MISVNCQPHPALVAKIASAATASMTGLNNPVKTLLVQITSLQKLARVEGGTLAWLRLIDTYEKLVCD